MNLIVYEIQARIDGCNCLQLERHLFLTHAVFDRFRMRGLHLPSSFRPASGLQRATGACEAVCGLLSLSADGLLCAGSV